MKDYILAFFVCALVAVDVVILFVYTLVEGVRGNLEPNRTVHAEHPSDKMGVGTRILYSCLAWLMFWGKYVEKCSVLVSSPEVATLQKKSWVDLT